MDSVSTTRPPTLKVDAVPNDQKKRRQSLVFSSTIHYQSSPQQPLESPEDFDDNLSNYVCCWCCHSEYCSIAIGILEIFWALCGFGLCVASNYLWEGHYEISIFLGVVPLAVVIFIVALMFYGIRSVKCCYLIMHIVFQVVAIVTFLTVLIVGIVFLVSASSFIPTSGGTNSRASVVANLQDSRNATKFISILAIVIGSFGAFTETIFVHILMKCYRYVRDKQAYEMDMSAYGNYRSANTSRNYSVVTL